MYNLLCLIYSCLVQLYICMCNNMKCSNSVDTFKLEKWYLLAHQFVYAHALHVCERAHVFGAVVCACTTTTVCPNACACAHIPRYRVSVWPVRPVWHWCALRDKIWCTHTHRHYRAYSWQSRDSLDVDINVFVCLLRIHGRFQIYTCIWADQHSEKTHVLHVRRMLKLDGMRLSSPTCMRHDNARILSLCFCLLLF